MTKVIDKIRGCSRRNWKSKNEEGIKSVDLNRNFKYSTLHILEKIWFFIWTPPFSSFSTMWSTWKCSKSVLFLHIFGAQVALCRYFFFNWMSIHWSSCFISKIIILLHLFCASSSNVFLIIMIFSRIEICDAQCEIFFVSSKVLCVYVAVWIIYKLVTLKVTLMATVKTQHAREERWREYTRMMVLQQVDSLQAIVPWLVNNK